MAVQRLEAGAVLEALGSSRRGLETPEVARRRAERGSNVLPRPRRRSVGAEVRAQLTNMFAVLLVVAAGLTAITYALSTPRDPATLELAFGILAVVVLNGAIGFTQEHAAERTAEALQAMVPRRARVIRGGRPAEVEAADLVPGDLVALEAGDAVPADCRLIEAHGVSVEMAALTGESEPVTRTDEPVGAPVLVEARNCVFMGTSFATGTARAVVFATGLDSEFGRIYQMTAALPPEPSPLQRQVADMARRVAAVAVAAGSLLFALRLVSGSGAALAFVFALGVMVALVPEGLPATLSVSLAIGVRRMARRHALIKRLAAVEGLGSTTVICTDKTGTLTTAEMTLQSVFASGRYHQVSGAGYAPAGEVEDAAGAREVLRAGALCCDARLVPPEAVTDLSERASGVLRRASRGPERASRVPEGSSRVPRRAPGSPPRAAPRGGGNREAGGGWRILGDTTEGAILVGAAKAGIDPDGEAARAPRVGSFPFDADRKLMTTVHEDGSSVVAYVKGSPQAVLARCKAIAWDGRTVPLDAERLAAVTRANDALAAQALRVLAIATKELGSARVRQEEAEQDLTFLGLVAMADPPRPEVAAAVAACRRAGIAITMVTGDYGLTAEAVARRVGIIGTGPARAVSGDELDAMDQATLSATLTAEVAAARRGEGRLLFARARPEHKLRIVTALADLGEIVAVTGDGANDAPALRRAAIGVAMGQSGTDVARAAAVMVLLDDSFASIAAAVELGRSVYENIRRFLAYLFSHNIAELAPILAATVVGFPLVPLTALQVLAIDLGSDVLPALALGAERPEAGTMDRPPRPAGEHLFNWALVRRFMFLGTIQSVGVVFAFFWKIHTAHLPLGAFSASNPTYREALTMTQAGIVVSQLFNSFTVRTDRQSVRKAGLWSNLPLVGAGVVGLLLMAAISYVPALQAVFHTAPLHLGDWVLLGAFGLVLLLADEARKAWHRHRDPRRAPPAGPLVVGPGG